MRIIFSYLYKYFYEISKPLLGLVSVITAILIYLNYQYELDDKISMHDSVSYSFVARWVIYGTAFLLPYFIASLINRKNYFNNSRFISLLLLAPAIFSFKVAMEIGFKFSENGNWNNYWNHIVYWPSLVAITVTILFIIWRIFDRDQPFYGMKTRNMNWKPYLIMLLIMVPLIAGASTQPDFLAVYPKLQVITGAYNSEGMSWWHKLLFELSYGSDFVTIEIFFRGFLILAFIKWAGKDAILPMACFYCTIHFGKPMGECISSYFGGLILGIIVYNTRSILGGLMVHLGIAWMMEMGGYIGNS